jgi:hypothetical protein
MERSDIRERLSPHFASLNGGYVGQAEGLRLELQTEPFQSHIESQRAASPGRC